MIRCLTIVAVLRVYFSGFSFGCDDEVERSNPRNTNRDDELAVKARAAGSHSGVGWVLLALVLSFVTLKLSMMLAMRRG